MADPPSSGSGWLKNVAVNLHATGPAAVMVVWMVCMTVLILNLEPPTSTIMAGFLMFSGAFLLSALAAAPKDKGH